MNSITLARLRAVILEGIWMPGVSISNPHAGSATEAGWSMGFAWGYVGSAFSSDPPLVIAPELFDAFNEGVLAGQQAAIEGLNTGVECVSLEQHASEGAETIMEGVHILEGIGLIRSIKHLAHFGAESLVAVFLLMIPGPPLIDPTTEFGQRSDAIQVHLAALGIASGSLYLGAGIDENVAGCELLFTPIYRDANQARQETAAMGRPNWILAEWNTGLPVSGGGFRIIDSA